MMKLKDFEPYERAAIELEMITLALVIIDEGGASSLRDGVDQAARKTNVDIEGCYDDDLWNALQLVEDIGNEDEVRDFFYGWMHALSLKKKEEAKSITIH